MVNDTYSDIISATQVVYTNIQYIYTIHTSQPQYGVLSALRDSHHRINPLQSSTLHEQTPPRLPRHTRPCHSQTHPAPASQRGAVAKGQHDILKTIEPTLMQIDTSGVGSTCVNLHQRRFCRFQNIVFAILVTDERTMDEQTDTLKTLCLRLQVWSGGGIKLKTEVQFQCILMH